MFQKAVFFTLSLIYRPKGSSDIRTTGFKMKAESANIWLLCAMSIVAMILFCCCVGPFTPFQDIGGDDSPQNSMVGENKFKQANLIKMC